MFHELIMLFPTNQIPELAIILRQVPKTHEQYTIATTCVSDPVGHHR